MDQPIRTGTGSKRFRFHCKIIFVNVLLKQNNMISARNNFTRLLLIFCLVLTAGPAFPQRKLQTHLAFRIDSLLQTTSPRVFNGSILIRQGGQTLYAKTQGYADILNHTAFQPHNQYVIGSVTKQITAVLVLQAVDQGLLDLHAPIRKYLPALQQPWTDSITTHQLLNHTSGVQGLDKPLAFPPGSRFSYSGDGYALLGKILEQVYGTSFDAQAIALFQRCKMRHSTAPSHLDGNRLLTGFSRQNDGTFAAEKDPFAGNPVPAGFLVSNPADITKWNMLLHDGRLLKDSTYRLMIAPSSKRPHPIFGDVDYGYGIQTTHVDGIQEISHGGYAPGYVTVNFYYPKTQVSLVVMENLDWKAADIRETFSFEMAIRKILREYLVTVQ
jgi:CubicO group peptidase (beta-lactamase class C family)